MENSPNQQDQDRDRAQRKSSSMEDSPAKTIEYLRARLLAERALSKTARQRADELANRVAELEEELKRVSLQRKKAEKATAEVLSILENHRMSESSEEFDSSSDQEMTHYESKEGNNSAKKESSIGLKVRGNDVDQFSGSELESVSLSGRSLSWKSGKDFSHSREKKYLNSSNRRQRSYASMSESPKTIGKSCRQIRSRETRSADEDLHTDSGMLTPQTNQVDTCSEGFPNCSDTGSNFLRVGSENQSEEVLLEGPLSGGLGNQRDVTDADPRLNGHGSEKDMERALEHQTELIVSHEAEEKAQREWEEKYRENNSTTPDSCELGNNSDITEERDEINASATTFPALTISSEDQEGKSQMGDVLITKESCESHVDRFWPPPHVDVGCLQDENSSGVASESPSSDFAFPMAGKGTHIQECSPSPGHPASGCSPPRLPSPVSLGNQSADMISSPQGDSSLVNKERSQNELALMVHDTSDKVGSVLEALQQAKLSLAYNLNRSPLIEGGFIRKAVEPSFPAFRTGDRVEVPVGCAGLFRVPADSQFEGNSRANFLHSGSRLSLTNYSPDMAYADDRFMSSLLESRPSVVPADSRFEGNTRANFLHSGSRLSLTNYSPDIGYADDRFMSSPLEPRPSLPADGRFLAISSSPYTQIRSTVPSPNPLYEPRSDLIVPPSSSSYMASSPFFESRPHVPIDNRSLPISSSPYAQAMSTVLSPKTLYDPRSDPIVPPPSSSFMASPYFESRPNAPFDNRSLAISSSSYTQVRSTLPSPKGFFEPSLDMGVPSSGRYTILGPNSDMGVLSSNRYAAYPTYPVSPLYPDLMPRMPLPSNRALSDSLSSRETGIPPDSRFSFYDDHTRPDMYR